MSAAVAGPVAFAAEEHGGNASVAYVPTTAVDNVKMSAGIFYTNTCAINPVDFGLPLYSICPCWLELVKVYELGLSFTPWVSFAVFCHPSPSPESLVGHLHQLRNDSLS